MSNEERDVGARGQPSTISRQGSTASTDRLIRDACFGLLATTVVAVGGIWLLLVFFPVIAAQNRPSWTYVTCYTNSCIKSTLDGLSADRAHDAKLTTWESKTYVWFREQAER